MIVKNQMFGADKEQIDAIERGINECMLIYGNERDDFFIRKYTRCTGDVDIYVECSYQDAIGNLLFAFDSDSDYLDINSIVQDLKAFLELDVIYN